MLNKCLFVLMSLLIASPVPPGQRGIGPLLGVQAGGGPPSVLPDVRVSPAADPDPRDDTTVATSLVNDNVIVGASKVIVGGAANPARGTTRVEYYFSADGGATWGSGILGLQTDEKTYDYASDPAIACDADGNFYLTVLMGDSPTSGNFDNGIYVFRSTDQGRTFGPPTTVFADVGDPNPRLVDRPNLAIDTSPTSPFKNSVYAVWIGIDPAGSDPTDQTGQPRVFVRFSTLRPGDTAFSPQKIISHRGDMRGPSVAAGPSGEVYIAWEDIGTPRLIYFNASVDGGQNFLPIAVAAGGDFKLYTFTGSLSFPDPTIPISGISRMNSQPVVDVDRSNGPNRGAVYVAWAEAKNGSNADIFLMSMPQPNNGSPQPTAPVKVNNDNSGADQVFPTVRVDPATGFVYVGFYDRRVEGGLDVDAFLAQSVDGGLSFPINLRLSSASSNPQIQAGTISADGQGIGIGDYLSVTAVRGRARMLWMDTRSGKQEIFFGEADFNPTSIGPPPPPAPANDACTGAKAVAILPFDDVLDTRLATSSPDDPVTCTAAANSNTVWYRFSPAVDSIYGIDTSLSDYDTVLSIYSGDCGSLNLVACNDDFGNLLTTRSMLTFSGKAGTTYLIEVAGKTGGGTLHLRIGYPTVTSIQYTPDPDGDMSIMLTGAGFAAQNSQAIVTVNGVDNVLPNSVFAGQTQSDGTASSFFATRKKLKKLIQGGMPVSVRVESPIGSGRQSPSLLFTR